MLADCRLDPKEQTSVIVDSKIFIHKNAFENVVCGMVAIL